MCANHPNQSVAPGAQPEASAVRSLPVTAVVWAAGPDAKAAVSGSTAPPPHLLRWVCVSATYPCLVPVCVCVCRSNTCRQLGIAARNQRTSLWIFMKLSRPFGECEPRPPRRLHRRRCCCCGCGALVLAPPPNTLALAKNMHQTIRIKTKKCNNRTWAKTDVNELHMFSTFSAALRQPSQAAQEVLQSGCGF